MEGLFEKPEQLFVKRFGWVREGQMVVVPRHVRVLTDGSDTEIPCEAIEGRVVFDGGCPRYVPVVECANANKLGVPQCCWKMSE